MKLIVSLFDKKSYDNAINQVKTLRDVTFPKMQKEFLKRCCEQIIDLANQKLALADIGEKVKADISYSWEYEIDGNKAKIINTADKAVYVEFGVGATGGERPHPNAAESGYEYNIQTPHKDIDDTWLFYSDSDETLDISHINIYAKNEHWIITRGQKGYMYLFNAVEDFKLYGYANEIWNKLKMEYGV